MTKAGEAEQTAYLFSEQTRSCTAEGDLGIENGPNEAGGYFPALARNGQKVVQWKCLKFFKKSDKNYGVEINSKTEFATILKKKYDITLKLKMWCNLKTQIVREKKLRI